MNRHKERASALWLAAACTLHRKKLPYDLVLAVLEKVDAWPWHVNVSSEQLHLAGPSPRHWRFGTASAAPPLMQHANAEHGDEAFAFSNLESHGASPVVIRICLRDAKMAFETRVPRFDRMHALPQGYLWFFGPRIGDDESAPRVVVYCAMLSSVLLRLTVETMRPHARNFRTYDRCLSPTDLHTATASLGELSVWLHSRPLL